MIPDTGIRVVLISLGAVATELARAITAPDAIDYFKRANRTSLIPGRIPDGLGGAVGQPEDVDVNKIIVYPVSQNL